MIVILSVLVDFFPLVLLVVALYISVLLDWVHIYQEELCLLDAASPFTL